MADLSLGQPANDPPPCRHCKFIGTRKFEGCEKCDFYACLQSFYVVCDTGRTYATEMRKTPGTDQNEDALRVIGIMLLNEIKYG